MAASGGFYRRDRECGSNMEGRLGESSDRTRRIGEVQVEDFGGFDSISATGSRAK